MFSGRYSYPTSPDFSFLIFVICFPALCADAIWENWKAPESGEWLRTCTIITGEPNELVAQIHPRMPVILPEQHHAAWLGETDDGNLKALLLPYPADQMRMWEISPRVNRGITGIGFAPSGTKRTEEPRLARYLAYRRPLPFRSTSYSTIHSIHPWAVGYDKARGRNFWYESSLAY